MRYPLDRSVPVLLLFLITMYVDSAGRATRFVRTFFKATHWASLNIMISQTDCDEEPHDMGERTMEIQLPVPRHDDQPQKDKEPKSATSLPTLKSGTPNSTNHSSPNSQPLQKLKVQKNFGDKDIFFAIKWTCGILTVAASIVFGIWAPLSYEATISDNDTDNAIVSVLSDAKDLASTANIIALNALETASEQSEVVGALYNTIGLMGQLAVMEFCYGQQVRCRCLKGSLLW